MGVTNDYGQPKIHQKVWIMGTNNLRLTCQIYVGMNGVPGHTFYIEERMENGYWKVIESFDNMSKHDAIMKYELSHEEYVKSKTQEVSITLPKNVLMAIVDRLYHSGSLGHELAFKMEHAIAMSTSGAHNLRTDVIKEVIEKLKGVL